MKRALVFNADFEEELAGQEKRARLPRVLATRLASRFLFLGEKDDTLLADFELPRAFRENMKGHGFALPRVSATPGEGEHVLLPWGAAPSLRELAERLGVACDLPPESAVRRANSKVFAHELAARLGLDPPGVVLSSTADVERALARFREGELWVVKRAFGFAGKGHLLGRGPSLPQNGKGWLEKALSRRDAVVLEPWASRERDLSVQLDVAKDGKVRILGVVEMVCARNGGWLGHRMGEIGLSAPFREELEKTGESVGAALAREGYFGPVGIDAYVAGKLRSLVEINARHTMGRVALALARLLPRGGIGSWLVFDRAPEERDGVLVTDPFPGERGAMALLVARDREALLAREREAGFR